MGLSRFSASVAEEESRRVPKCKAFGLVCLMLNVPVSNFSVMLGRSHRFLGIISTFFFFFFFGGGGGVNMSCSRTQHGDPRGARTPDL